jgi:DNA-binding NtrC family response regulator
MTTAHISQPVGQAAESHLPRTTSPQRILVVDDDGDLRQFNFDVLVQSGYHVETAEDGAVAWDLLPQASYDLLVTDNDMPKVSGVELLKTLHAAHRALPAIMATGTFPEQEFGRHPWIRPAAVILKPYTVEKLLGTVKEVLLATVDTRVQALPPPNGQRPASSYNWEHHD